MHSIFSNLILKKKEIMAVLNSRNFKKCIQKMIGSHWKTLGTGATLSDLCLDIALACECGKVLQGLLQMLHGTTLVQFMQLRSQNEPVPYFCGHHISASNPGLCTARPHFSCIGTKWWQPLRTHLMPKKFPEPDMNFKRRLFHCSGWNTCYF